MYKVSGSDIQVISNNISHDQIPQFLKDVELPNMLSGNVTLRVLPACFLLMEPVCFHHRLCVFFNKGSQCVKCGRIGKYIIETYRKSKSGEFYGYHIDVYDKDFNLMTVDHIYPKSKGGDESLNNKQPMCEECNYKKSDKIN